MNVLLTAFKPFNNKTNNYSYEVLKHINGVSKVVLDVCYDSCYFDLKKEYNLDSYDLIISLGEARMRSKLMLETTAKNNSSCSLKDNNGIIKIDEKIINKDIDELMTLVDLDRIKGLIELSNDAGKFVCNNLYFHLLNNYPNKSLFIHIPECNDEEENYIKHAKIIEEIIFKLI